MGAKKLELVVAPELIIEWSRWYDVFEKGKKRIKRYSLNRPKVTWERYPAKNYKNMTADEIGRLLARLNASYVIDKKNAEARYDFDHTYVNKMSIKKFESHIAKRSNLRGHAVSIMQMLDDYIFNFFINQCKIPDPSRWHLKEDEWGDFLLALEFSSSTVRRIVATANRFNKYLVEKVYPEMPTPGKLETVGKAVLDKLDKDRDSGRTKYIKPEIFEKILAHAEKVDPATVPAIKLIYYFGLRIYHQLLQARQSRR